MGSLLVVEVDMIEANQLNLLDQGMLLRFTFLRIPMVQSYCLPESSWQRVTFTCTDYGVILVRI
uniref:Uncharacterized protein n=1 Tax=Rhizophora mucronata TaxID=61149 RepID=A0A2P2JES7_RHIMU